MLQGLRRSSLGASSPNKDRNIGQSQIRAKTLTFGHKSKRNNCIVHYMDREVFLAWDTIHSIPYKPRGKGETLMEKEDQEAARWKL